MKEHFNQNRKFYIQLSVLVVIYIFGYLALENYKLNSLVKMSHLKIQVFDKVIDFPNDYVVVSKGFSKDSKEIFLNGLDKRALIGENDESFEKFIKTLTLKNVKVNDCSLSYAEKKYEDTMFHVIFNYSEHIAFLNEEPSVSIEIIKKICKK